MNSSTDVKDLFAALSKAQSELESLSYDAVNPHFKNQYSTLAGVQQAIRGPLGKHGLSVLQLVESTTEGYFLETVLGHLTGQFITSKYKLIVGKNDMQGLGSAITYAKRYSLMAVIGISAEKDDDDAQKAVSKDPGKWVDDGGDPQEEMRRMAEKERAKDRARQSNEKFTKPPPQQSSNQTRRAENPATAPAKPPPQNHAPKPPAIVPPPPTAKTFDEISSLRLIVEELADDLGSWKFPSGRHEGKSLMDLSFKNAEAYANWVQTDIIAKGTEPLPMHLKAVEMFEIYKTYEKAKAELESQDFPPFDPREEIPF